MFSTNQLSQIQKKIHLNAYDILLSDIEIEGSPMSQVDNPSPEEIALLISLAEQGDKIYQFTVGIIYSKAFGVAKDEVKAVKWFKKAAEQGLSDAQFNMGQAYFMGKGVPKNHMKALHWYCLAAEQGDTEAMLKLGIIFVKGNDGVPLNLPAAVRFLEMAKANGDPDAIKNLDLIYESRVLEHSDPCNTH